tara:strand:- start:533 stop:961 length:429 start_codon:yes stop_codon:yes gene_type:complete
VVDFKTTRGFRWSQEPRSPIHVRVSPPGTCSSPPANRGTFAPQNLFYRNNYDFNDIFPDRKYAVFRHTSLFRDGGFWDGAVLGDVEAIIRAPMPAAALVGRVDLTSDNESLRAEIEFPIKTMNANDTHWQWQVDSRPIALPP